MSYLVMECHPGYAVLLDEDGRFLKAANLRYEVGQTVYDPVLMQDMPARQWHTTRWIRSGIVAIAACFLLFFGVSYYQNYLQPYSFIYLSINPEVQMELNRQGTVVGLTGTNEDGETLLEGYDSKGKDKVTVADELIDRAIEMGFLSEGGQVSFSIDSPDDVLFQEYGTELRTNVTEHLDGRITITIEIINHKNSQEQENPENSSSPNSSPPTSSPPASTSPSVSQPSRPAVTPPISSNSTDYDDTDYGSNNDGVSEYTPPSTSTPATDTDYGSGSDWDADYTTGNTDYDPGNDIDNDLDDDGDSNYGGDDNGSDNADSDYDYSNGNDGDDND